LRECEPKVHASKANDRPEEVAETSATHAMIAMGLSGEICCPQRLSDISDANKFDAIYWVR